MTTIVFMVKYVTYSMYLQLVNNVREQETIEKNLERNLGCKFLFVTVTKNIGVRILRDIRNIQYKTDILLKEASTKKK